VPIDHSSETHIAWHPAFFEGIQLELEHYTNVLRFISEYQLTLEPLRIDVVIIKKVKDTPITKNIAAIFRSENLVEYKSPTDYLSVWDFYKVYGYAYLYASLNKIAMSDLTLTFVGSRHPRDLLAYLREVRGYKAEEREKGIWTVTGDVTPIQVIDNRELSEDENVWLKGLDNRLEIPQISRIEQQAEHLDKDAHTSAYFDAIIRANMEKVTEMIETEGIASLKQILEKSGLTALWIAEGEARGRAEGRREVAIDLIKQGGFSIEQVARAAKLDIETIKSLIQP
jgi:predicted HTH domain antitoxin